MSTDLATVEFGDSLQDAWTLLRERRIKALPVVDNGRRVVGIVTLSYFMRHADLDFRHGWPERLRSFLTPSPTPYADKPATVSQIMGAGGQRRSAAVGAGAARCQPSILPSERLLSAIC